MMPHDGHNRIGKIDATENLRSHGRMKLHLLKFSRCQSSRLIEDMSGYGKFSNIVQQRSGFQGFGFCLRYTKDRAETRRIKLDPAHMTVRGLILGVNRRG